MVLRSVVWCPTKCFVPLLDKRVWRGQSEEKEMGSEKDLELRSPEEHFEVLTVRPIAST